MLKAIGEAAEGRGQEKGHEAKEGGGQLSKQQRQAMKDSTFDPKVNPALLGKDPKDGSGKGGGATGGKTAPKPTGGGKGGGSAGGSGGGPKGDGGKGGSTPAQQAAAKKEIDALFKKFNPKDEGKKDPATGAVVYKNGTIVFPAQKITPQPPKPPKEADTGQ